MGHHLRLSYKQLLFTVVLINIFSFPLQAQEIAPVPVKVASVKASDDLATAEILGTVYSRNQVQLSAGVSGRLEWVAEPGSYLKKGDLVAQIELFPLQLQQAEQKAQLKRAQINLQYLSRELDRQQELRSKNSSSQYQLDQTQSQYELAQSDLEIAELKVKQSSDQLGRATIRSPFAGVVTSRMRRAGFDVARGDVLVELLDTENLEVRLFVPVKYLSLTKIGSPLSLSSQIEDGSDLRIDAFATTIIPTADERSQTFEMRVTLPELAQDYWATGQMVKVNLPIETSRVALTVHRDALILRRDGTYVVKIDSENKSHRLKVKVGRGKGEWVSVEGELSVGDLVAIRGAERLIEGQLVEIQTEKIEQG